MVQTYPSISDTDNAGDVLYDKMKSRTDSLRSNFSGTEFPENPVTGMYCFREDLGKFYYYSNDQWNENLSGSDSNSFDLPLFFPKRFPALVNDISWLRSDTFSWQDGSLYKAGYKHLVSDFSTATLTTETVEGLTIQVYVAEDGHKLILPEQITNLNAIYQKTGVGFYFVFDSTNQRFKLPRTLFGFKGYYGNVGEYVHESVPKPQLVIKLDGTSTVYGDALPEYGNDDLGGSIKPQSSLVDENAYNTSNALKENRAIDVLNDETYYDDARLKERGTQAYLYFYMGTFEKSAIQQSAGLNTEMFNSKMDNDLNNLSSNIDYVIATKIQTDSDKSWYRIYKSGWCEQGGRVGASSQSIVTLSKSFIDSNYSVNVTIVGVTGDKYAPSVELTSNSTFTINSTQSSALFEKNWEAKGQLALGEY